MLIVYLYRYIWLYGYGYNQTMNLESWKLATYLEFDIYKIVHGTEKKQVSIFFKREGKIFFNHMAYKYR